MSNRLFQRITSTLAFLSCGPASPQHTIHHNPSMPKRLLHDLHATVHYELRRQGADRVWPCRVYDDNVSAAYKSIAAKASANLGVPLPFVKNVLFSIWLPRMEHLMETKKRNMELLFMGCSLDDMSNMLYSEYKGEWKFLGSQVAALPRHTAYEAFQALLRSVKPKGFADDPEEIGCRRFAAACSTDGVGWGCVGYKEVFQMMYQGCLEYEGVEFTVVFLENHWVPPQQQDFSLKPWILE